MSISVLEAIKMGIWDYEPKPVEEQSYDATEAMPGTNEKLKIMAARVESGLPIWHGEDRRDYDQ